jgi:hypothetical protein
VLSLSQPCVPQAPTDRRSLRQGTESVSVELLLGKRVVGIQCSEVGYQLVQPSQDDPAILKTAFHARHRLLEMRKRCATLRESEQNCVSIVVRRCGSLQVCAAIEESQSTISTIFSVQVTPPLLIYTSALILSFSASFFPVSNCYISTTSSPPPAQPHTTPSPPTPLN